MQNVKHLRSFFSGHNLIFSFFVLAGLAIQWGPIGDVGIFISHVGDNDTVLNGTSPQRITSCLQSLDFFMTQSKPVVCSYVTAERKTSGSGKSNQGLVAAICNIIGKQDIVMEKKGIEYLQNHIVNHLKLHQTTQFFSSFTSRRK